MSDKDSITKEYISNPKIFADLFNYYVFNGEQNIIPESLIELDTTEIINISSDNNNNDEIIQKYRDVLKKAVIKTNGKIVYVLLGIENQSDVHYAMPARCMLYDAMQYYKQLLTNNRKLKELRKESSITLSNSEYTSGFRKDDTLIPVMTLVVYFGKRKLDGATSLHQMFDDSIPKEYLKYVADYDINLIDPYSMTKYDFDKLNTYVRLLLEFIKVSNNKNATKELLYSDKRYRKLDKETANVIGVFSNYKINFDNEEGGYNMCKAFEDYKAEGKAEGIREGKAEGIREGKEEGKTEALYSLLKDGLISADVVAQRLGIPVEEVINKYNQTNLFD